MAFFVGHELADIAWYGAVILAVSSGRRLISGHVYRMIIGGLAVFLLVLAALLKADRAGGLPTRLLDGKTLYMIFFDASTRTRNSFETGITQLGGHGIYLSPDRMQISHGENAKDTANVLSRYGDGIAIRHCTYGEGNAYIRDFFERQGRYYRLLFEWEDRDRDVAIETMRQHRGILTALLKKNWSISPLLLPDKLVSRPMARYAGERTAHSSAGVSSCLLASFSRSATSGTSTSPARSADRIRW